MKHPIENAKLGGAYGLFLSSFLLQLQDPMKKWTIQAIAANVLVFVSMMLTKAYNVNSECSKQSTLSESGLQPSSEPISVESQSG